MNQTRLLLLALVTSLAVNLFFVGGIFYRFFRADEFIGRPLPPNINWMVRDLSEERRAEMQPLLEQSADEIRPIRRELFESQRHVNELMMSADFDREALEQAFSDLRDANLRYQRMSHRHSVEMLNHLSPEEREKAVAFIHRRGPMDGRDRRMGDDGRPDFGPRSGKPPLLPPDFPL
jgi:uncharacterized membrane protein